MTHETDETGRRLIREFSNGTPRHRAFMEQVGVYKELIDAIPLEHRQAIQDAALQRRRELLADEPQGDASLRATQDAALQRRREVVADQPQRDASLRATQDAALQRRRSVKISRVERHL